MKKRTRWILIAALVSVGLWKLRSMPHAAASRPYGVNLYNVDYGSGGSAYL